MVWLNNDRVLPNTFVDYAAFQNFENNFSKRQQEYAYMVYGGPYIKWYREADVDAYILVNLLQYLHDIGCPKITLAVFERVGETAKLPLGLSIGYPASHRGCNWIHRGYHITDDETICKDHTVYKYILEGIYDSK